MSLTATWKKFDSEKPEPKKTYLWAVKRKEGWQTITGFWKACGDKIELWLDDGMTYTSNIALPSVKAHWTEVPEFKPVKKS